jgi:hypothetical protein
MTLREFLVVQDETRRFHAAQSLRSCSGQAPPTLPVPARIMADAEQEAGTWHVALL